MTHLLHLPSQYQVLVSSLRHNAYPGQWDVFDIAALPELYDLAVSHQVASAIAFNMGEQVGWDNVPKPWRLRYERTDELVSTLVNELDEVAACFARHNIPLAALKNSGIARGIFPHPGAVPMGDVDVLVEKKHFRQAHELLLGMDYKFEFRSALEEEDLEQADIGGGAEYWKMLANGDKMWLELQWRPVAGRWIRPDQEPPSEELLARSIAIPGTAVRLLAPEDNLLQVCLHTAKHSYVRAPGFRLHLDAERVVRAYPDLDWALFVDRVATLQVKTAVYFSLAIPADLLETPVPTWVLDRLKPASWKERLLHRWIRRAGLFNPNEKKFSRLGYILFTALLYDDLAGLWRGILPDRTWMRNRYQFKQGWLLPYFHLRRLGDLLFRRART